MLINNYMSKFKVLCTLEVAWDRTIANKQTLFPVWGDREERKPRKGVPDDNQEYTLRATKGVNMHPFPVIELTNEDGTKYSEEEDLKLTLVGVHDKLPPPPGACSCGGSPTLTESKQFQLFGHNGETYCKIRGGVAEFTKLQIGCCTGPRGHGAPICIKAEFIRGDSPLLGEVFYSLPIEVGAKGPFAKIFSTNGKNKEPNEMKIVPQPKGTYEGAEDMMSLLNALSLQKYAHLFLQQEVDLKAFIQLTDADLTRMGITLVGPRVKIMQEINRLREEMQLPALLPSTFIQSEDSSMWSLSSIESYFDTVNNVANEQPAKRRRMIEPSSMVINEANLSIYVYLAHIINGKNALKKVLFMIKSMKDKKQTESIVQEIQQQVTNRLRLQGKRFVNEEREAQLMVLLQPDKNGDWQARCSYTDQIWNFRKGDYIKINNHHNVDIGLRVHHFFIPEDSTGGSFIEDVRSPTKYPILFPGGSLEIGLKEHNESRLALAADLDPEISDIFAVSHNGNLIQAVDKNTFDETCIFLFKRRKPIDTNMKKISSLDDFQKELFLSRCLDPTCLP